MKKAILYTRVGKLHTKKNAEELIRQENELRKYCEKNELEIVKIIHEYADGKDFNRLHFTSLYLDLLNDRVKADYLLFTDIHVFCENICEVVRVHHNLLKFGITTKATNNVNVLFVGIKRTDSENEK